MSIFRLLCKLEALKQSLESQSYTKRCAFERFITVRKIIKMAKRCMKWEFRCQDCALWERNMVEETDNEAYGWGQCHLNNEMPQVFEADWCYYGMKITRSNECEKYVPIPPDYNDPECNEEHGF